MDNNLKSEFKYYLDNQNKLVEKYNGKFIIIKNTEVIGIYDSELEAIEITSKEHSLGTFLVQKCEPGQDAYTQKYHSRVTFNNDSNT